MARKKTGTKKKARRKISSGNINASEIHGESTAENAVVRTRKKNHVGSNNVGKQKGKVSLEESLTISTAAGLKDQLSVYPGKYREIEIDGAAVELIDTAAFQIIVSFITQLRQESVEVRWVGKSEVLVKTADLLGLKSYLEL